MTLLTIENAKSLLKKIEYTRKKYPVNSVSTGFEVDTLYVYDISCDSVLSKERREIAFTAQQDEGGLLIFVNKFSKYGFLFFDFFDNEDWLVENSSTLEDRHSIDNIFPSILAKFPSLNLIDNDVLKLRVKQLEDFRILVLWYVGYSYSQDEICEMLRNNNYHFPASAFDISSSKVIEKGLLKKSALSLYLKTVFGVNEKQEYYREIIQEIIGVQKEEAFFDSEKSNYFKVISLFYWLSRAKKGWHGLILGNMKYPSISNEPAALEYDGFIGENSINTHEHKSLNDAILRYFYKSLINLALLEEPSYSEYLIANNECVTYFDTLLAEFDIYLQKLLHWHVIERSFCPEESFSSIIDEALIKTRMVTGTLLKEFKPETEIKTKDDLVLTLIKCASLNRAENEYNAYLNLYSGLDQEIPDRIELMSSIHQENEILGVLLEIFDIQESQIPTDLLDCARMVNGMCSKYFDLEATHEQLYEYKTIICSPACVGASAAQILNGYIKSNFGAKKEKDFKIRIKGETNPGINVYNELSKLVKTYNKGGISLDALYYCMPDALSKYVIARFSILYCGMVRSYSVKQAALAELRLKVKAIELQKEIVEQMRDYSFEYICLFLKYFKSTIIYLIDFNMKIHEHNIQMIDESFFQMANKWFSE